MLEEGINVKDSGTFRTTYHLDPDSVAGFETAVRNGQTRLALEHAVAVIQALRADVDQLRNQVAQLQQPTKAPAKKKEEPKDAPVSN